MFCLVFILFFLSGCNKTKTIDGITYDVFGIANESELRKPDIKYQVSIESIIFAAIFSETIIIPVYIICFDLWEPVSKNPKVKWRINRE